jgi:hypothetical protein
MLSEGKSMPAFVRNIQVHKSSEKRVKRDILVGGEMPVEKSHDIILGDMPVELLNNS